MKTREVLMCGSIVASAGLVVTLAVAGCNGISAEPIKEGPPEALAEVASDEPYACVLASHYEADPIWLHRESHRPPCQVASGGVCNALPGAWTAYTDFNTNTTTGSTEGGSAFCVYTCEGAEDCPAPTSGSIAADCRSGSCGLYCDSDAQCPQGFLCLSPGSYGEPSNDGAAGGTIVPWPRQCLQPLSFTFSYPTYAMP